MFIHININTNGYLFDETIIDNNKILGSVDVAFLGFVECISDISV